MKHIFGIFIDLDLAKRQLQKKPRVSTDKLQINFLITGEYFKTNFCKHTEHLQLDFYAGGGKKFIRAGYLFFITKYTAFSIAISRENPQIFRLRRGNPLSLAGKFPPHFSACGKKI